MKTFFCCMVIFIVITGCAGTPDVSTNSIKTTPNVSANSINITPDVLQGSIESEPDDYSTQIMHYFENKNDSIIYETISYYENTFDSEELDHLDSNLICFFYGIKTDNNNLYNEFNTIVNNSGIHRLIKVFDIVNRLDILAVLEQQEPSGELLDAYWSLFFATGNVKYLDNICEIIMMYYNDFDNIFYYFAARTGIWSISSNLRTFPLVQEHLLNNNILNQDVRNYIIFWPPVKIMYDTIHFVKIDRGFF